MDNVQTSSPLPIKLYLQIQSAGHPSLSIGKYGMTFVSVSEWRLMLSLLGLG